MGEAISGGWPSVGTPQLDKAAVHLVDVIVDPGLFARESHYKKVRRRCVIFPRTSSHAEMNHPKVRGLCNALHYWNFMDNYVSPVICTYAWRQYVRILDWNELPCGT
mgnify:CR=1 FL=1